jgi:OmcA/MtrC family decaheme c-type cytochrome
MPLLALMALVAIGVTGCENDDNDRGGVGPTGPAGPVGPTGPTGPTVPPTVPIGDGGPVTIGDGTTLTQEQIKDIGVLRATLDTGTIPTAAPVPVIEFTLKTAHGGAVTGLAPSALLATVAKLVPPASGVRLPSAWQSYVNVSRAGTYGPKALPAGIQATSETGTAGTLVDLGAGKYRYTYKVNLATVATPIAVSFQPSLTHRLGFEIRLSGDAEVLSPDNPFRDVVPDGGAGSGNKLIAATENCDACHERLDLHGGPRHTVEYCVTCHNPASVDPDGGESVDMAYMVHSIHTGVHRRDWNDAPTFPPLPYKVWGFGGFEYDFSDVTYPQPLTFCENCHTKSVSQPDGDAWIANASASSCGGCHAYGLVRGAYSTTTGQYAYTYEHSPPFGFVAPDGSCKDCHRADGVAGDIAEVHRETAERRQIELGKRFVFEVLSVSNVGKGKVPRIAFKVSKPDGTSYDLATDPAFQNADSTLNLYLAWDTNDITNADAGTGKTPAGDRGAPYRMRLADIKAFAVRNADGSYTTDLKTAAVPGGIALPVETVNVMVTMDGHPVVFLPGVVAPVRARAHNAVKYSAAARVPLVSEARCNACHQQVSAHGDNRNGDPQGCLVCHNASSGWSDDADIAGPIAMGAMIHNIHANRMPAFADITYPQGLGNCEACHLPGTYYAARKDAIGISTGPGADPTLYTDDTWDTATAGTCGTCHDSGPARAHMEQNGGAFGVLMGKTLVPSSSTEACAVCHGPGRQQDTVEAHAN